MHCEFKQRCVVSAVPNPGQFRDSAVAPIVVIGAGPVGVRLVNELHRRMPDCPIVLYGAERWSPYNRVRLSSALAGETAWVDLMSDMELPESPLIETRLGCKVVAIDRVGQCIVDEQNFLQPYRALVFATGSSPHMPSIPGIDLPGVYAFRDMDNALQLAARRARTHCTVVLGGGLLGIEAARAMQRSNTEIFLVEHYDRLMPRQLDKAGSDVLQRRIEETGIQLVLGDGPQRIYGNTRVEGVQLRTGQVILCDTVIVAAGIRPNIELARHAKLSVSRGIRVDDRMCTSDPNVFAIGECAEHRGQVYGLVAPGLEQAGVAAHVLAGGNVSYPGSSAATRLKVLNFPVFSMGEVGAEQMPDIAREHVYSYPRDNIYRKLVVQRGRLIGALALGPWNDISRIQEAVSNSRHVWPWQLWHFRRHGTLWSETAAEQVQDWPASTVVCNCTGVTRGRLSEAIAGGCRNASELAVCTGASTVCGSCKHLLMELAKSEEPREPVRAAGKLLGLAVTATALALIFLLFPGLPFSDTVSVPWRWDNLWRDSLSKQVSGYVLLALALTLSIIGLRKRVKRFTWGDYPAWRMIHVILGVSVLLGFLLHTGGHMGSQLNFFLAASFIKATFAGGLFAALIAREHEIDPVRARRMKSVALWGHVIFVWPLPVLLAFHIVQGYVF